jgi:transcription elongation factor GreA-like protein
MKRLLSDLVLFTLVKVSEENIRWAIVYHFFGLVKLFTKKELGEFSLSVFQTLKT